MSETLLSEELSFELNPLYEEIIDGIQQKHYAVVEGFFAPHLVENLRNLLLLKYEEDELQKSAVGNRTNEVVIDEIRGDFIQWMDESKANEVELLFFEAVTNLIDYLNRTCFMGILHKEFHYAIYPKGTFYKRHLDTFQNDDRRVLSMVFYLNDEDWKVSNGGELAIYELTESGEKTTLINPLPGRLVIFESQILEHEVLPVKASERLSITGWLKTR